MVFYCSTEVVKFNVLLYTDCVCVWGGGGGVEGSRDEGTRDKCSKKKVRREGRIAIVPALIS